MPPKAQFAQNRSGSLYRNKHWFFTGLARHSGETRDLMVTTGAEGAHPPKLAGQLSGKRTEGRTAR